MTIATYPRAFVALSASVGGEQVDTGIEPSQASFTVRSHSQAGSAEVTVHGSALPFDPRVIDGVYLTLFMGDVGEMTGNVRTPAMRRFVGYVDELEEKRDDGGPVVSLKARDLTALLRDFKPVPRASLPRYSDTLGEAINKVLAAVPAAQTARMALAPSPLADKPLAAATHARAATAYVQVPPDATAWQVIEHCAGLVATLVYVKLESIVLADPAQSYQTPSESKATFVFGDSDANLLSLERSKKFVRNRKGIVTQAYDPVHRRVLTAKYPADADLPPAHRPPAHMGGTVVRQHSTTTRGGGRAGASRRPPEREPVAAPAGIQSQAALLAYARRVYEERSRQEMEGKLVCPGWSAATPNDVLALGWQDRFELRVNPGLEAELRAQPSESAAVALLQTRMLVNEAAARALLRAAANRPTDQFLVRSLTHEYAADGECHTTGEFVNLIEIG